MTEEQQAERLAKWLENPDSEMPEDLDPEVLGAVFTLSPKRAPAPRVTIDEILAGIPAAPPVASAPVAAPPEAPREERRDRIRSSAAPIAVERSARPTSRLLRWAPGLSIALAASLVALFVIPVSNNWFSAKPMVEATMPEMAATAVPAKKQVDSGNSPKLAEVPNVNERIPPPTTPMGSSRPPADQPVAPAIGGQAAPTVAPPPPPAAPLAEKPADMNREQGDIAVSQSANEEEQNTQTGAAPSQFNDLPNEDASAIMEPTAGQAESIPEMQESRTKEAYRSKAPSRNVANAAPASAPMTTATAKSVAADDEVASVWPMDYNASWYTNYADVVTVYNAAKAQESAGAWSAAAVAYRGLMNDSRSIVAQDAAWYCARAWWQAGQASTAIEVIDQGLARSSANTPYRARLFALKGDVLAAMGKNRQSQDAYREASSLNAGR